jgi:hypothetical protein
MVSLGILAAFAWPNISGGYFGDCWSAWKMIFFWGMVLIGIGIAIGGILVA